MNHTETRRRAVREPATADECLRLLLEQLDSGKDVRWLIVECQFEYLTSCVRRLIAMRPWLARQFEPEDVVHDGAVILWSALGKVRVPKEGRLNWLHRLAMRILKARMVDIVRRSYREARARPVLSRAMCSSKGRPTHESLLDLHDAISMLPSVQQSALRSIYWQEMSQTDAAAAIGVCQRSLRRYLHAARTTLRLLIESDVANLNAAFGRNQIVV